MNMNRDISNQMMFRLAMSTDLPSSDSDSSDSEQSGAKQEEQEPKKQPEVPEPEKEPEEIGADLDAALDEYFATNLPQSAHPPSPGVGGKKYARILEFYNPNCSDISEHTESSGNGRESGMDMTFMDDESNFGNLTPDFESREMEPKLPGGIPNLYSFPTFDPTPRRDFDKIASSSSYESMETDAKVLSKSPRLACKFSPSADGLKGEQQDWLQSWHENPASRSENDSFIGENTVFMTNEDIERPESGYASVPLQEGGGFCEPVPEKSLTTGYEFEEFGAVSDMVKSLHIETRVAGCSGQFQTQQTVTDSRSIDCLLYEMQSEAVECKSASSEPVVRSGKIKAKLRKRRASVPSESSKSCEDSVASKKLSHLASEGSCVPGLPNLPVDGPKLPVDGPKWPEPQQSCSVTEIPTHVCFIPYNEVELGHVMPESPSSVVSAPGGYPRAHSLPSPHPCPVLSPRLTSARSLRSPNSVRDLTWANWHSDVQALRLRGRESRSVPVPATVVPGGCAVVPDRAVPVRAPATMVSGIQGRIPASTVSDGIPGRIPATVVSGIPGKSLRCSAGRGKLPVSSGAPGTGRVVGLGPVSGPVWAPVPDSVLAPSGGACQTSGMTALRRRDLPGRSGGQSHGQGPNSCGLPEENTESHFSGMKPNLETRIIRGDGEPSMGHNDAMESGFETQMKAAMKTPGASRNKTVVFTPQKPDDSSAKKKGKPYLASRDPGKFQSEHNSPKSVPSPKKPDLKPDLKVGFSPRNPSSSANPQNVPTRNFGARAPTRNGMYLQEGQFVRPPWAYLDQNYGAPPYQLTRDWRRVWY